MSCDASNPVQGNSGCSHEVDRKPTQAAANRRKLTLSAQQNGYRFIEMAKPFHPNVECQRIYKNGHHNWTSMPIITSGLHSDKTGITARKFRGASMLQYPVSSFLFVRLSHTNSGQLLGFQWHTNLPFQLSFFLSSSGADASRFLVSGRIAKH